MKKIIVLMGMMFIAMSNTFAKKGIKAVCAHISYGSEVNNMGLGAKFQYNLTDNIRLEPSMNYFFENETDLFDINANAHYLFPIENNIRIYPLAGLTFGRWGLSYDFPKGEVTRLGINLGGGAEMDITDNLMINAELKYQYVNDLDQAVFNIGVAYMF